MRIIYIASIILIGSILSLPVFSQTKKKIEADAYIYGGREFNIFQSPAKLYDLDQDVYVDEDSLIISDNFVDVGYDFKFRAKKKKKYVFEFNNDFWHRSYFEHSSVNQSSFKSNLSYERVLSKKISFVGDYRLNWHNKIGTSVSGEELLRSFKYLGNLGQAGIVYKPIKEGTIEFGATYNYKHYYDDTTSTPLHHNNLAFDLELEYEFSKKHAVGFGFQTNNRHYKEYFAADSNGSISPENPLRQYKYFQFEAMYKFYPVRGFLIEPKFKLSNRKDMYQDYYSYDSYSIGIKARYMNKKFYAYFNGEYRQVNYVEREAYTQDIDDPSLTYDYFKFNARVKYKVVDFMEVFVNLQSDNRDSNTELEHARTRRPYNNYEIRGGLTFKILDRKY